MSKVNRRKFITAAVGGAIVVAAGYGYYEYSKRPVSTTQSPTISATETSTTTTSVADRPPKAAFALGIDSVSGETYYLLEELNPITGSSESLQSDVFKDKPKWNLNPTTEQVVKFLNHSTDEDSDNLSYVWSLNGKEVSGEKDFSIKLPEGENSIKLMVSDGKLDNYIERKIVVDPDQMFQSKDFKPIKGMVYETGLTVDGQNMHRNLTRDKMKIEILDIINKELGCDAIIIRGDNDDLLFDCAEVALEGNFKHVVVVPRYISEDVFNVPKKVGSLTKKLQPLYEKSPKNIIISPGNEISADYRGIIEGETYIERGLNVPKFNTNDAEKLEKVLKQTISEIRQNYHGKIIYDSAPWESWRIDWRALGIDIMGLNLYWYENWLGGDVWNPAGTQKYIETIGWYKGKYGLPIWITEVGSVTTKNGCKHGGSGHMYAFDDEHDPSAQALCIKNYLEVANRVPVVEAVFLFEFVENWTGVKTFEDEYLNENIQKMTFGVFDYEGPKPMEPGDYILRRKEAAYMIKSYKRVGS